MMFLYVKKDVSDNLQEQGHKPIGKYEMFDIYPYQKEMLNHFSVQDKSKYMFSNMMMFDGKSDEEAK